MNQPKYEYQSEFARRYVREGQRDIVLRQLAKRFGPISPAVQERVELADTATLEVWADRLLTAVTLDEVLSS